MKKVIALVLSLALAISVSTAFAAELRTQLIALVLI